ncbi:MAG: conjugal transfer protein TraC [Comamonadaceae bacterium]|nr:conjugal transfer protein TraC [Comamonadaceae bacterium]
MGFLLEVMPQSGADERMVEVLISLYANCPPGTGIQFHLFASPHIAPASCASYANLRVEDADQAEQGHSTGAARRATTTCSAAWPASASSHLLQGAQESLTSRLPLHDARLPADAERRPAGRPGRPRHAATNCLRCATAMSSTPALGLAAQPRLRRRRPDQLVRAVHQPRPDLAAPTRPTSTTTTAARSATRSSTSTPSRTPHPSGLHLWKEGSARRARGALLLDQVASPSASRCGRWAR